MIELRMAIDVSDSTILIIVGPNETLCGVNPDIVEFQ